MCAATVAAPFALTLSAAAYGQALEEIIVTARKTTESLQEVPQAITAITAEQIDRLGIKGLDDLAGQDSSVQFDLGFAASDTRITIRGLSPTRGRPNAAGFDCSGQHRSLQRDRNDGRCDVSLRLHVHEPRCVGRHHGSPTQGHAR